MTVRHAMLALLSEESTACSCATSSRRAPPLPGRAHAAWTRIKEDDAGDDLNMSLAVDAEMFRLDSVARWLDAAEARVNRAATEGATTWADQASPRNQTRAPLPRQWREMRVRR